MNQLVKEEVIKIRLYVSHVSHMLASVSFAM